MPLAYALRGASSAEVAPTREGGVPGLRGRFRRTARNDPGSLPGTDPVSLGPR